MVQKLINPTKTKPRDYFNKPYVAPTSIRQLSRAYRTHTTTLWWKRWWLWLLISPTLLLISVFYIPIFTIKNVIIPFIPSSEIRNEIKSMVTEILQSKKYNIIPQSNLIFFNTGELYQILNTRYDTRLINIERHWPNILKIYLGDSIGIAEWHTNNLTYLLDTRGFLIREFPTDWATSSPLIKIIEQDDNGILSHTTGERIVTEHEVEFFRRLYNAWKLQFPEIALQHIIYNRSTPSRLDVVSQEGWYIKLTTQEDAPPQLAAAARVWHEKKGIELNNLEYIDVRYGSRVYIKQKDSTTK